MIIICDAGDTQADAPADRGIAAQDLLFACATEMRRQAAEMAALPSSTALRLPRLPWNAPIGVRAAPTMYISRMSLLLWVVTVARIILLVDLSSQAAF